MSQSKNGIARLPRAEIKATELKGRFPALWEIYQLSLRISRKCRDGGPSTNEWSHLGHEARALTPAIRLLVQQFNCNVEPYEVADASIGDVGQALKCDAAVRFAYQNFMESLRLVSEGPGGRTVARHAEGSYELLAQLRSLEALVGIYRKQIVHAFLNAKDDIKKDVT